jgi:RNA polymerase primary sigma factor
MPSFELTPTQKENLTTREAFDIELQEQGATYERFASGKRKVLELTPDQMSDLHDEMDEDRARAIDTYELEQEFDPTSTEGVGNEGPLVESKRRLTTEETIWLESAQPKAVSKSREFGLITLWQETGDIAVAERIVQEYEWLVSINIPRVLGYFRRVYGDDLMDTVDTQDLMQVGRLGLLHASAKADLSRDNRFSTYADYWVRQKMWREIYDTISLIRLPGNIHQDIAKARKSGERNQWVNSMHRLMRPKGENRYIPGDDVDDRDDGMGDIWQIPQDCIGGERELVTDIAETTLMSDVVVQAVLNELTDGEKELIILRYGMFGGNPQTLGELGRHYAVSRERVRQIEGQALRKLRKCVALAEAALPSEEF